MGRGAGASLHTHRPAGRHPHLQPHAAPPPTAPASAPTVQPPPRGDLSRMHGPRYVPGSGLHASQETPVSLVPGCVATRLCGRWLAWPSSASCICSLRSATNTPKPTVLPPDCDGPQTHVSVGAPAVGPPSSPPGEPSSGVLSHILQPFTKTFVSLQTVSPTPTAASPARGSCRVTCLASPWELFKGRGPPGWRGAGGAGEGRRSLEAAGADSRPPSHLRPPQLPGNRGQGQDRQLLHHGAQAWPPPGAPPKI